MRMGRGAVIPARSSESRYGSVAITFHWLSAALILTMIFIGMRLDDLQEPGARLTLLRVHAAIGLTVLALTVPRLLWRLLDRQPGPPAGTSGLEWRAARTVHLLLTLLLLGILASGMTTVLTGGALEALIGVPGASLPENFGHLTAREVHGTLAWSFTGLLILHVSAALYHHWARRDDALRRMWWGG